MSRRISNRDAVFGMTNAIYDSSGAILGGQIRNLSVVKFDDDGTRVFSIAQVSSDVYISLDY